MSWDITFNILSVSIIIGYIVCGLGIVNYIYFNKTLPESISNIKECLYYGLVSIPVILLTILFMILGLAMFTIFFILIVIVSPLGYLLERFYSYIFDKIMYKM